MYLEAAINEMLKPKIKFWAPYFASSQHRSSLGLWSMYGVPGGLPSFIFLLLFFGGQIRSLQRKTPLDLRVAKLTGSLFDDKHLVIIQLEAKCTSKVADAGTCVELPRPNGAFVGVAEVRVGRRWRKVQVRAAAKDWARVFLPQHGFVVVVPRERELVLLLPVDACSSYKK